MTEPRPSSTSSPSATPLLADGASGFATSDGLQIHYAVFGEGAPLVLVHGWGGNIELNWKLTGWIDKLRTVRQVVAIDIRGHGDSDKPHDAAAYGYAPMASDVIAVMDHLGIEKADYLGYSLGAFSGAHLLGHDQDRFTSFVLIGIGDEDTASLAAAPRIAAALRAGSPEDIDDPQAAAYRALVDLDPRNDREALAIAALEMWPQGYPVTIGGPGLADTDVPVLIINGSDDPYAATVDGFADAVPGAEVVEILGVDHLGVLLSPATMEHVLRFLDGR